MAGYKLLKRKGVDEVSDDFCDFSLCSPATKIRRLDAELPPIEEVEVEVEEPPLSIAEEKEEAINPNLNEERALVLFKPPSRSPSSSSFSLTLNSDFISEIKNWSKQHESECDRIIRSQEQDKNNQHLALVPWVPSISSPSQLTSLHDSNNSELMEAEADEMGGGEAEPSMMMDVEQQEEEDATSSNSNFSTSTIHHPINPTTSALNLHHGIGGFSAAAPEGLNHQWQQQQQQQQHCLLPQFPPNTSTPIAWTH